MSENIAVANDEMEVVPMVKETITYTKLDGTTVSAKADDPITVFDSWVLERILMNPSISLRDKKTISKFKLHMSYSGFGSKSVENPDDEEFKLLWAKFLADPNVKITN